MLLGRSYGNVKKAINMMLGIVFNTYSLSPLKECWLHILSPGSCLHKEFTASLRPIHFDSTQICSSSMGVLLLKTFYNWVFEFPSYKECLSCPPEVVLKVSEVIFPSFISLIYIALSLKESF